MDDSSIQKKVGDYVTSFFTRSKNAGPTSAVIGTPIRVPHGPFQFSIQLPKGTPYEVQAGSDLVNWLTIANETAPEQNFDYVDADASKFGFRFYRVVSKELCSNTVLGFASVSVPPGFCMVANPFQAADNSVAALFPKMPDGSTLHKFDTRFFKLNENVVKYGRWTNPMETMVPGEGALLFNPTSDFRHLNFFGEVLHGNLMNPIPAGFSIRSSLVPLPGRLNLDLGFPGTEGDVIHIFDRDSQKYVIYNFNTAEWEKNGPVVGVGESFWVGKTTPENWKISCNPRRLSPPST